jgi:hypothetical protein
MRYRDYMFHQPMRLPAAPSDRIGLGSAKNLTHLHQVSRLQPASLERSLIPTALIGKEL